MSTQSTHNILPALAELAKPIGELNLDPANARTHNPRNIDAIAASLAKLGQHRPAVVQREGMVVRVGNGMVEAARKLGWSHVAAIVVDENDVQATARAIADNQTALLADWDDTALGKSLQFLQLEKFDLEITGFDAKEFQPLIDAAAFGQAHGGGSVNDPGAIEPPKEAVSRRGDLWLLGAHRLLCGDSTDGGDVAIVMNGEKAGLMVTDPPYGVNFTDAEGKNLAADMEYSVIPGFFGTCLDHVQSGRGVLCFGAETNFGLYSALYGRELKMRPRMLFWKKSRFVLRHHDYHSQYEVIYYGWTPGGDAHTRWHGSRDQSDVWEVDHDVSSVNKEHITQKPVELFERAIQNHTKTSDVILEPFSGSGSQLIAAEKLARRCYAMEIEPRYVDVALRRWERSTGKLATLEATGRSFAETAAERGVKLDVPEPVKAAP